MKRSKVKNKSCSFDGLPYDCIYEIMKFLDSNRDFWSIISTVKGYYEYLISFKPNTNWIEFTMHTAPQKIPHKYSFIQNLRISHPQMTQFLQSGINLSQFRDPLSYFHNLKSLTIHHPLPNTVLTLPTDDQGFDFDFRQTFDFGEEHKISKLHIIFKSSFMEETVKYFLNFKKIRNLHTLSISHTFSHRKRSFKYGVLDTLEVPPTLQDLRIERFCVVTKSIPLSLVSMKFNKCLHVHEDDLKNDNLDGKLFPKLEYVYLRKSPFLGIRHKYDVRNVKLKELYLDTSRVDFENIEVSNTLRINPIHVPLSFHQYKQLNKYQKTIRKAELRFHFMNFKNPIKFTKNWEGLEELSVFYGQPIHKTSVLNPSLLDTLRKRHDIEICGISTLKYLHVGSNLSKIKISKLHSLRKLSISDVYVFCSSSVGEFVEVEDVPSLRSLYLRDMAIPMTKEELKDIRDLKIEVRVNKNVEDTQLLPYGLNNVVDGRYFKSLEDLEILVLDRRKNAKFSDVIRGFRGLRKLRRIKIRLLEASISKVSFDGFSNGQQVEEAELVVGKLNFKNGEVMVAKKVKTKDIKEFSNHFVC